MLQNSKLIIYWLSQKFYQQKDSSIDLCNLFINYATQLVIPNKRNFKFYIIIIIDKLPNIILMLNISIIIYLYLKIFK